MCDDMIFPSWDLQHKQSVFEVNLVNRLRTKGIVLQEWFGKYPGKPSHCFKIVTASIEIQKKLTFPAIIL